MAALARIRTLVGVEVAKALGGKTLKVGLVATVLLTALFAWNVDRNKYESAWTTTARSMNGGLFVAEIFLLVAGATAIAGESAQGTLKMILPHAYRRSDWVAAKAIVLAGQAVAFLLAAGLAAVAAGLLSGGYGDVVRVDDTGIGRGVDLLHQSGEMGGYLLQTLGAALASLVATAALGLLVSCVFDSVVPALSAAFLVVLGAKSAGTVFAAGQDVTSKIYSTYPSGMLSDLAKMDNALDTAVWNADALSTTLRLSGIVVAASLVIALVVFSRRDLQS